MSQVQCPNGHLSADPEWCDTCGARLGAAPAAEPASGGSGAEPAGTPLSTPPSGAPVATADSVSCPHCGAANTADALFCEDCGYDFTTGQKAPAPSVLSLDTPVPGTPSAWVAEVWVDPTWYEANAETASDPCPAAGLPAVLPLHHELVLIGRKSASKGIFPDIDCSADTGVSRRHAELTRDGDRWYVEDLGSTNGTFVAPGDGSLPADPIAPNRKRELGEHERIYVGAWTRIVVRAATPAEQGA